MPIAMHGLTPPCTPFSCADGRTKSLSDPGMDSADTAGQQQFYVQMVPIWAAAFCQPVSASMAYLKALRGSIQWRQREFQDVGVLAVRCVVARQRFDVRAMTLQQLIHCRPADAMHNDSLQLLLPEHDLPIMQVRTQLDQAAFDDLVYQHLRAPAQHPWAFIGPGNFKADGWLVLRVAASDLEHMEVEGEAVAAAEPNAFIIYVSSKQRTKAEKVSAKAILQEKKKDVISNTFRHVYIYVTDQQLQPTSSDDALAPNNVYVVSPQDHDAFYGCVARLLELVKL